MKNLTIKELDETHEDLKKANEELLEAEKILLMAGKEEVVSMKPRRSGKTG